MCSSDLPDFQRVAFFGVLSAVFLLLGSLVPANWKSLHPALLERAGQGSSTAASLGLAAVKAERPGVANLALSAAMAVRDEQAPKLTAELATIEARRGGNVWGGSDPFIEAVFKDASAPRPASEPILPFLLSEANRAVLRERLLTARSPGAPPSVETLATALFSKTATVAPVADHQFVAPRKLSPCSVSGCVAPGRTAAGSRRLSTGLCAASGAASSSARKPRRTANTR